MFRNFFNMFRRGEYSDSVSHFSRMKNPQQIVRFMHNQGKDICYDQAERLMYGIHQTGIDEVDVDDLLGLDA